MKLCRVLLEVYEDRYPVWVKQSTSVGRFYVPRVRSIAVENSK